MSAIYIHIPYCKQKCGYCSFYSITDFCSIEKYIDATCREVEDILLTASRKIEIDTIYIGGGTPSMLPYSQLKQIFDCLYKNSDISKDAEITIEVNPESANLNLFTHIKLLGINRISIGLQSHDNEILKTINRSHTYEMFENAVNLAAKLGFNNISADIILGLPNQDKESVIKSLELITSFESIKHISMYALTLDEDCKLYKEGFKIDIDLQADLYNLAFKFSESKGFDRYEISNFARKSYESRHNQKYWTGENYYGFGAGAHSLIDGVRIENKPDIKAYINQDFAQKKYDSKIYHTLSIQEKIEEYIMLSLRTVKGINLTELKQKYSYDLLTHKKTQIEKFLSQKLLIRRGNSLAIVPNAFYIMNAIVVELL
ncbi:MAG: radical SAM family heme chaperone HemW [Firmicutes bacterium]|nr:radical SAM family heme chaperone HemW [Bacillota bacterium]